MTEITQKEPPATSAGLRDRSSGRTFAQSLVDVAGSRRSIPTPALVCDLDVLTDNIARMARLCETSGVTLRPHLKSHKSAFIASLQLEHGACGLSCAKLSEAEAVVEELERRGVAEPLSILITSPIAGRQTADRALALAERCELLLVVDHVEGVDEIERAALDAARRLSVLCDVDVGLGRTGITSPDAALAVARRIEATDMLDFAGVQGYAGHAQHTTGRVARREVASESARRIEAVVHALEQAGIRVALRTGGGTGTSVLEGELGVLNELQAGSYVFMDREYRDALGDDPEGQFAQSLFVTTTVISSNQPDFVTVDAGLKSMATDAGNPTVAGGVEGRSYHFFGDEHGLVTQGAGEILRRGDRLDLVVPHCDPTVDRYDFIWMVRGDRVVSIADVTARGCSQ